MKKILLIGFNIQEDVFPLGLMYLKSYATKQGSEVDIRIKEFSYGNRFSYDVNKNLEIQVISYIQLQNPDVIMFSSYIWSIELIKQLSLSLKKLFPQLLILLGGVEVTKDHLSGGIDFIMQGEGEQSFYEFISYLSGETSLSDVSNISYYENNKLVVNKTSRVDNLDDIPFPYRYHKDDSFSAIRLETSRGCPYQCKFCYYAQNPHVRNFSFKYLEKNIAYLFDHYDFKNLTLLDANFNISLSRMKEVLDIISKNSERTGKEIIIHFELKPELITPEVISLLETYNIQMVAELGLQSVDEHVLFKCGRRYNFDKIKLCIELLEKSSLFYKIDLMYGLPEDTFFTFLRSAQFLLNHSRKQNQLRAHHFMVLNNSDFGSDSNLVRFHSNNSSLILNNGSESVLDIYLTKLYIDLVNQEMKLR